MPQFYHELKKCSQNNNEAEDIWRIEIGRLLIQKQGAIGNANLTLEITSALLHTTVCHETSDHDKWIISRDCLIVSFIC